MKTLLINILLIALFWGCSTVKMISSWKNLEFTEYKPHKVLVIGVTPNHDSRKVFEFQLVTELNNRGINALQSYVVFESLFQDTNHTEKDIESEVNKLIAYNYDSVLVSLVKGVDNNLSYGFESAKTHYHLKRFFLYYLLYQDRYFEQNDNRNYKVYSIETSIYNLKSNSDKSLIWHASFDLIDPNNSKKTIKLYNQKLIKALEKAKIIPKRSNQELL
ncbi:hypothetical protein [Seonamhaeicola aphaedonensis]|uniref:Uncharacterized protein n=1 Tax=Seonamhaeicola aphaedonensis TaxID=1461338 RepID=A0A3D9HIM2_9FLAO|nr:hypothetical protein [Seonamhaeicola aphaedonensis]RED49359.1 hypothetical protein DFQ02_102131 [Seonamhaeicola aphaedonensis]